MPRLPWRRALAALLGAAIALSLLLHPSAALAENSSGLTFSFAAPVIAYPCRDAACGGGTTATVEGAFTGLDNNGHPFTASFTGSGNSWVNFGEGQGCSATPAGELSGDGGATLTPTGGTLVDNGVQSSGASAYVSFGWWQYGTALVITGGWVIVYDSSGTAISTALALTGAGAGYLIPTWPGGTVPVSCFDTFPANLQIGGAFAMPA